jgi:nucleotide-binding universal stress UspA family protein
MTTTAVHQCFRCELRFVTDAELEDHLQVDHRVDLRHPVTPAPEPIVTHGSVGVAIGPSVPVERAAEAAVVIARQAGMAVDLVEVDEPGYSDITLDHYLRTCADRARAAGVAQVSTTRLVRSQDGVAATLLQHLCTAKPTFAAMLTRRHSALGDVVLGSVSRPVVAMSPVPVLLSHPTFEATEPYRRIVVGVDGSALAERAIGPAVDLADRLGASVWIVQAVDPDLLPGEWPESGYVSRLAAVWSAGGRDVGFEVLHGTARDAMVDFGTAEPGTILVVGSHGRSGSRLGSLGSVSRDIVRKAEIPVMVVGPAAVSAS